MKFIVLLILFTLTLVNGTNLDADFTSLFKRFKSLDLQNADFDILEIISFDLVQAVVFMNYDCVAEKLGVNEVDESEMYEIKNITEFQHSSSRNLKILTAILNAAKICSEKAKEFVQQSEMREFDILFPDLDSFPEKSKECFRWSLSKFRPNSLFIGSFSENNMNSTVDECKNITAATDYIKIINKEAEEMDLKSCTLEAYVQAAEIVLNVIEIYLYEMPDDENEDNKLVNYIYSNEKKVLINQLTCIMNDLRRKYKILKFEFCLAIK